MSIDRFLLPSSLALLISACGGGGGGSSTPAPDNTPTTGQISFAITDAPVDEASSVVIQFSGMAIKPADGDELVFEFDTPKSIDLLNYQGAASEPLLENETVEAGEYNWIRLMVNSENGISDSYIVIDGNENQLTVPSGNQTGLKLVSGFTVAQGGTHNFTIDFDLAKSIVNPASSNQDYKLKPALRLVNNLEVGTLSGTVTPELVSSACTDSSINNGLIYLYEGADIEPQPLNMAASPVFTTALIDASDNSFEIGFLNAGDYTITYTCDNDMDEAYDPDNEPAEPVVLVFNSTANVSVTASETTSVLLDIEATTAE